MGTAKADGRREDVRDLLLDAAEALFADRGYFGVSIREITDAAGMRLAAVNYHFGTKERLFKEVLTRRSSWLSEERQRRLEACMMSGDEVGNVRQIVRAFYAPLLERFTSGDPGWRNYCRLTAQVAGVRLWMEDIIAPLFNPIARRFTAALVQACPGAREEAAISAYQFLLACTLYSFTDNRRLDTMSEGALTSEDLAYVSVGIEEFCTGGILRMLHS